MSEFFQQLESHSKEEVKAAKQKIIEQFGIVKDSWLLNGLYDYYLSTNSANVIEIMVYIREPHHSYLFERLSESIGKSSTVDVKVQALTLLGHIVRNQPTWLFRLPEHSLLKVILRLLKVEVEILPLISALLLLIVLIPMVPHSMGEVLNDVFEIFSRLASWNCNPGRLVEDQVIHMQVALYSLFLRLYGMFPCNFLSYLRTQYKDKNRPVFIHTVKPMLESVRMNPSLVTTSKDNETTSERWKKMAVHDIIVECERYSLDVSDTFCAHDSCQLASGFRSRSGTTNSALEPSYFQSLKTLAASMTGNERGEYFTPSMVFSQISAYLIQPEFTHDANIVPQAGSSPPEAAIEATPETTPVLKEIGSYKPTTSPLKIRTEDVKKSPTKSSGSSTDLEELMCDRKCDQSSQPALKQSDSVLHESEDSTSENMDEDRNSPCDVGGLHMPNPKTIKVFAKRVQRLRHHSQCNPEPEPLEILGGSSPEMTTESTKVRRAHSCPEMKKSPVSSIKDNVSNKTLDETDEDTNIERAESGMSNGIDAVLDGGEKSTKTCDTQTDNFWPMPYEHLFLAIFPTMGVDIKSSPGTLSATGSQEKYTPPSVYEVLDRYVETAVQDNEKDTIRNLRNQLKLIHQQLLFERHRREIHAFKNRRFLADAKSTQVLEEHNSALRDQVQLQQTDIDNLKGQLKDFENDKAVEVRRLINTITTLENRCKNLEDHNKGLKEADNEMKKEVEGSKSKCLTLSFDKQKTEASLLNALMEVEFAKEQALAGDKGRAELEFVNKQLLLIGELQLKYKERLEDLTSLRRSDHELILLKDSYTNEMKTFQQRLRDKCLKLEACTQKICELEQMILHNEETIASQKRLLNSINEETDEKLKALEVKYQTQLTICRTLEEKIFELRKQLELSIRKPIRSPDTSSCQEVQVSSDKISGAIALSSQRSSPLSCSLASSEGSVAPAQTDTKGLPTHADDASPSESGVTKEFESTPSTSKND